MEDKYRVLIKECADYSDIEKIRRIVAQGIESLEARPHGNVILKYNMVFAHRRYARFSYTHPNFLEALIDVLAEIPGVSRIILAERTSIYVPTRYHFAQAGYSFLAKKPKVEVCFFDEAELVEVPFKKGTLHKSLLLPKPLVEADYKVYAPKLKHHVSTRLTCALKLNIGICDTRERLAFHDWRLEEKIADLYEPGHPDLVVVDAVQAGQQSEITSKPLDLGIIMMGTSGVAVDSVAARIIGFDPDEIEHLKIARSRGWEPTTDDKIEIDTEIPMEEILDRTKHFDYKFSDLTRLDTPVRFHLGNYPDGSDLCHGGCMNMIKSALGVLEANSPGSLKRARPVAVVIGEYDGDVDGKGLPILFIGDCTKVRGEVRGKTRRIRGCPVAIPKFMTPACWYFRVPTPYMDPVAIYGYPFHLAVSYVKKFLNRSL